VLAIGPATGIAISIAGLVLGWAVYDGLCRSPFGRSEAVLAAAGLVFLVLVGFAATRVFSARGAFMQMGALIGTIMAANVLMAIIPGQRKVVADLIAGRTPDPIHGQRGKQRSTHNNYLTLPVVFAMLSNHFPFTYGHEHAWLILVCLMALGALTRHFFNVRHSGKSPWWILGLAAAGTVALAIAIRPQSSSSNASGPPPSFATVQAIVAGRCTPCHSLQPTQPGYSSPPAGVVLETAAQIKVFSALIKTIAVDSKAMPPGNVTGMTQAERDTLARWLASR
jgi:uncharacterized membrane protein